MSWLRTWAWRLGLHPPPSGRGLLVVTSQPDRRFEATLDCVRERHPRINVFHLTPAGRSSTSALEIPGPVSWSWVIRRYLRRLKLQAIMTGPHATVSRKLRDTAHEQGIEIVVVDGDAEPERVYHRLAPLLATSRPPGKASGGLEAQLLPWMNRAPLSWLTIRKFSPIRTLEALRRELRRPATILCLGNGPSSEDSALADVACDALFRVNHQWLGSTRHTSPDVIFTGMGDTLRAYPRPAVFAFQTEQAARRVMLRSVLLAKRIRYCTAEQLGCIDFSAFAPYTPTNGAVMIALAAALRPARLIVAGMDLFSDPRGAYPGHTTTPNAYTVSHDRDVEARVILQTLATFPGEVVIVGEVLESRWQAFRNGCPATRPNC